MKILITGGSGLIGTYLRKSLQDHELYFTYHSHPVPGGRKLDISDSGEVLSFISEIYPDIIIHTAAVPSMDICETDKPLAEKVNIQGAKNMINAFLFGLKIVYISTSYVYPGGGEFSEESPVRPVNYYGETKLEAEKIISESNLPFLILRTDQPYGWAEPWQKKNSVVRALDSLQKNQPYKDVKDWFNNPTYAGDLAGAVRQLIEKDSSGIYNAVGPDYLNRVDWSKKIADVFGLDPSLVQPIESSSLNLPAKRMNARLSTKKLQSEGIRMSGVLEGMQKMKAERASSS